MATDRTADRTAAATRPRSATREMFVVVFPSLHVLPVPPSEEVVGRDWLKVPDVSRQHVVFTRGGGKLHVTDVGSRHGTFVNGTRLPPQKSTVVDDQDVLRLGDGVFVYCKKFVGPDTPDPPLGRLISPFGLRGVRERIDKYLRQGAKTFLIQGETGTGKELIASWIAMQSGRENKYTTINVTAIPHNLFESHLFGHVKGAFSGADRDRKGAIASYDRGVVFLDEIGDLPRHIQPKLLRFLDSGEVQPVGGEHRTRVDVFTIAATNRQLAKMVAGKRFRQDLHARFSSSIQLPELSTRREDIFAIAQGVGVTSGTRYDIDQVEAEAVERLLLHPWESNVRDLVAALERVAHHEAPPALLRWAVDEELGPYVGKGAGTADEIEAAIKTHGSESKAAKALGMSRGRLRSTLGKR